MLPTRVDKVDDMWQAEELIPMLCFDPSAPHHFVFKSKRLMNVNTLGLLLHFQLASLLRGRVEFHIPVLHLDTAIQTNKVNGSRANKEATTDRHGDGLLIWHLTKQPQRQLDFEYSSSSGQSKSSVERGNDLNRDAHKNPVQVEDVVDSNHFCSTHFALFSFVFRRVSPFVRLRIFRRSQWFTLGRCFRQSGIFYLEITHTYK